MNWLCCLLLLAPFQSSRSLKQYIRDGNAALENGQYEQALKHYKEAFRLQPKAARVRTEGTFSVIYLPRYTIALCYEQSDILEAEVWALKSKEALEEDTAKKDRKVLADYHRDLDRIIKAADEHRADVAAKYQLALTKANSLLDEYKFDEAKAAFEALYTMDPSRPEGTVGLDKVASEKANLLRTLTLDTRDLVQGKRFDQADEVVAQIVAIDPGYREIEGLRTRIANARKAEAEAVAAAAQPQKQPETVAVRNDPPPVEETYRPQVKKDPVVERKNPRPRNRDLDRAALKTELLASLAPYRRGDPQTALQKLEEINLDGVEQSASYHWLHGVYLLTLNQYQNGSDESLLSKAGEAMKQVAKLQPGFAPNADLYPDFVLTFYNNQTR